MDRKGITGMVVAFAVLLAWEYFYQKNYKPAPTRTAAAFPAAQLSGSGALSGTSAAAASSPPAGAAADAGGAAKPEEAPVPETTLKATGGAAEYTFTNVGGGISRIVLQNYMAEKGRKVTLNEYGAAPIGAMSEAAGQGARDAWTVTRQNGQIVCSRTDAAQMEIIKRFTLPHGSAGKDAYLVTMDVSITNRSAQARLSDGYFIALGSAAFIHHGDRTTYTGFDWYHNEKGKFIDVNWFASKQVPLLGIQTSAEQPFYSDSAESVLWAGVANQYFTTILSAAENPAKKVWARRFSINTETTPLFGIEGALGTGGFKLEPGQTHQERYALYAGPKEYRILKQLGNDQEEIMNFNWTKYVSIFLLTAMNALKGVLGNYVAAILVLTICIKSALWIPQNAATKSMKKMQALQPKMTELREKYADDPSRMNQELMKLYKDYGVNPFAGCLPMFIQIPIFFGFFNMLGGAVELRGSGFLWVKDLSQPDTIATIAGYHVNLLPLIMAVTMLWQMSITPKTGDPVQQRIFMFVPLVFVFFCYNFASALSLYYTVQNLFSIAQLYVTRSQTAPALQKISGPPKKKRRAGP